MSLMGPLSVPALAALAVAPVVLPLLTALLTALAWHRPRLQWWLSVVGVTSLLLVTALLLVRTAQGDVASVVMGRWGMIGIGFRVDRTGALLLVITAMLGLSAVLYLSAEVDVAARGGLLPLTHGLLAGVCGAFCTFDLFNLYVWFEVMLICALGLLVVSGTRAGLEGAFKYLTLNVLGTLLLLVAVGAVYAATGHLRFSAVAEATRTLQPLPGALLLAAVLLAFLLKAAAFPLSAWLPASYHTLPIPLLALFAGLLTKVGVYAILRCTAEVFAPTPPLVMEVLGWIAAATMLVGVLGAAYHWDLRRILAFHIISQIGYILMAIALGTAAGDGAAIFYTAHHIIAKANLFFLAGIIFALTGSYDLRRTGGLSARHPWFGILFLIPALALVGIPPLSGFWAKLLVLRAALAEGRTAWAAIALGVSLLTLYSMVKVWLEAFWKPSPGTGGPSPSPSPAPSSLSAAVVVAVALAMVTLAVGLFPEPLLRFASDAAATLTGRSL